MYDVLLTNPCGRTGLTVRDSLERLGLKVKVMEGPSAKKMEDYYIRTVSRFLEEEGAGMVIPVFFPEVLASHKDRFPGTRIPIDDAVKIRMLDNKNSACRLAKELGIPQPDIFDFHEPSSIEYPAVFRRALGQGGDSVYFPKTERALRNLLKSADEDSAIITRYIEGWNVSVDALRWGDFFYAAAYRILEPQGKGVSTLRQSILAPELVSYCREILDHIDYQGVCGMDFRVDGNDGKPYFLECNPRFSGGLESAIKSGFDIPSLYYRLATGERIYPEDIIFTPGILTGVKTEDASNPDFSYICANRYQLL